MNSSFDRSPSIFSTPSAGRRIIQKIASPFGPKTRSISEFTVRAHDPHKQYSPGERVKGAVVVKVVKPIRLTHISVCLHGFVQVYKTPGSPAESVRDHSSRMGKTQGKKSGQYFGNGFASLFEDESVVCGDGRLAEGSYRFEFEVAFPKDIDLPSSIEFERGTISYMVTATLTRPTTMNPTISHDQRLFLCERIDIAALLPPKPRTITLEPVVRKARPKPQSKRLAPDSHGRLTTSSPSTDTRESATSSMPNAVFDVRRTPSVSEASFDSRPSSSMGPRSPSGSASHSHRTSESFASPGEKTITATVESLKGGCLRGDTIPVRVVVNHTKHVKSINGVMITLYRMARVDLHPALPLGPMTDGQKRKYEDYYPRSLTGLGGLSLSGTGSSHVFRKDLAQTVVPLIVDPQTLKSEINARVRVPEDAFPTINTVPGSMISFRYYIEVVLDIQGKLAGSDKFFSQKTGTGAYANHPGLPPDVAGLPSAEGTSPFLLQGSGILDTTPIRRDKSVVTSVFEVVVGTLDSERRKGKERARTPPIDENVIDTTHLAQPASSAQTTVQPCQNLQHHAEHPESYPDPEWYEWGLEGTTTSGWPNYLDGGPPNGSADYFAYENGGYYDHHDYGDALQFILPPPLEDEENMPEKERLRRAEARLMPSEPPNALTNTSFDTQTPSAPILAQEYLQSPREEATAAAGPSRPSAEYTMSRTLTTHGGEPPRLGSPLWSGPFPVPESDRTGLDHHVDDKQEVQRRQLQLVASAPPNTSQNEDSTGGAEPSVPTFEEDATGSSDAHDVVNDGCCVENLPRYFR